MLSDNELEFIRSIADRLTTINRDICGSNRLLVEDEIGRLREVVRRCQNRHVSMPASPGPRPAVLIYGRPGRRKKENR